MPAILWHDDPWLAAVSQGQQKSPTGNVCSCTQTTGVSGCCWDRGPVARGILLKLWFASRNIIAVNVLTPVKGELGLPQRWLQMGKEAWRVTDNVAVAVSELHVAWPVWLVSGSCQLWSCVAWM